MKSQPAHLVPSALISTREQKVIFTNLGGPTDEQWIFTPTRVWKQSVNGTVITSRENPREAFKDHTLTTPWDDLHLLYFCGYAIWQYFNFPFLLSRPDVISRELEPHKEGGETWRVLEVTYPGQETLATHTEKQTYFFNEGFMLQRHDYAPDVLEGNPATHFVWDPVEVGGLKFPTLRRVVAKGEAGPMMFGPIPTLIHLVFLRIELGEEGEENKGGEVLWERSEPRL
jgi:hypothetical protein